MESYAYRTQPSSLSAVCAPASAASLLARSARAAFVAPVAAPVAVRIKGVEVAAAPWSVHVPVVSDKPGVQVLGTGVDADKRGGFTVKAEVMGNGLITAQRGVPPRGRPV